MTTTTPTPYSGADVASRCCGATLTFRPLLSSPGDMTEPQRNPASAPPFRQAVQLLTRTTPFLLFNLAIYGGFFLAVVLWLGFFGGLAILIGERVEFLAFIFLMIAVFGPGAILAFGRRYFLYLVKGTHIAVITKLLVDGQLPSGVNQITYGRRVVARYFKEVSVLFVLDRMVDRVVKRFTRRFVRLVDWLPLGGGASKVARWASAIVNRSLSYVDQAIISHAIAQDDQNIWRSARHGLILYAQAYPPILMTAVKVWLLGRVFFLTLLIVLGIPAVLFLFAFSAGWVQLLVIVGVLVLTSLLVRAVFEPFATAYTVLTFHHAIEGLDVDPTWDDRLQSVSGEFKKLIGRAREFEQGGGPAEATSGGTSARG